MYFNNFTSFNFFYFLVSPDPPDNCTIINKSSESFHLQCIPGNLFANKYLLFVIQKRA